ncbi:fatty acid cis/trans isomerase [Marinomonas spartinae]|uniref:fatty acid cis/trans isomerase n=1 Tax=Marinomonas spartinae TaxID=1792290 RepID=UPI0018F16EDA|nr:fatty acid cis/trans isomerase [Marinomonas spartinae]MBJ7553083.1 fatty acid cis/trans isomerase [Marinomonas spartinae]
MPRALIVVLCVLLFSGCALFASQQLDSSFGVEKVANREGQSVSEADAEFYNDQVRPILDNRCVTCHACYDAPCQLKFTAPEGIERGGSKELVYDGTRLLAATPTRLFIDAQTTQQWRDKGFYPVLNERRQSPAANLDGSLVYRAIALRKKQGNFTQAVLSDDYDFSIYRNQQCPTIEEYSSFEHAFPRWGMPYGLPALTDNEFNILVRWLASGAKMPAAKPLPDRVQQRVALWESRLNGNTLKERLVDRYIYEHVFLYSLYLGNDNDIRFKLVRSKTPPGQPIDRIATRRPYDDPGVKRVYYRLWRDPEVKVQKNHIPFELNETVYKRWQSDFYSQDYKVTKDPGYSPEVATNPFKAFAQLPVGGRYRFMLDHAQDTIMSFIKGPVCHGQVAVNVINDHFWVFFVNPEKGINQETAKFLETQVQHLDLPAESSSNALPLSSWVRFSQQQKEYLSAKAKLIDNNLGNKIPLNLSLIWNGDGHNENAALTIFRNFDNASVVKGLVGQDPKTAWVIDYPLLERIHYLLVAGFDVYGNVGHQLNTRLYMDFLRIEGEMNFLMLLPRDERSTIRQYWYRGANQTIKDYIFSAYFKISAQSQIHYTTSHHEAELFNKLKERLAKVLNHAYDLDETNLSEHDIALLKSLQTLQGKGLQYLPNTALVLVTTHGKPKELLTLILNQAHSNISSLLNESATRLPSEDTVTVTKGVVGDYPNLLMRVEESDIPDLVHRVSALQTREDFTQLVNQYGIRRTNPAFWTVSDEIAELNKEERPRASGILDYNRLENR